MLTFAMKVIVSLILGIAVLSIVFTTASLPWFAVPVYVIGGCWVCRQINEALAMMWIRGSVEE